MQSVLSGACMQELPELQPDPGGVVCQDLTDLEHHLEGFRLPSPSASFRCRELSALRSTHPPCQHSGSERNQQDFN